MPNQIFFHMHERQIVDNMGSVSVVLVKQVVNGIKMEVAVLVFTIDVKTWNSWGSIRRDKLWVIKQ